MKKHNLVYKTTNLVNGKIYIGVHSTNKIEDGYLGSGRIFKRALKKYGEDNFQREILFNFDSSKEAFDKERELVTKEFIERKDNYNFITGGFGGTEASEETRKRLSENNPRIWLGKKGSEIPWFGKPISEERKQHLSKLRMGENNPMWGKKGELNHIYGTRISKEERLDKKEKRLKNDPEFCQRLQDIEESNKERGWKKNLARKWGVHPRTALMFIRRWYVNDVNREQKCLSCGIEIHPDGEYCRPCFCKSTCLNIFADWDLEELKKLREENNNYVLSKRFNVAWKTVDKSFKMRGL